LECKRCSEENEIVVKMQLKGSWQSGRGKTVKLYQCLHCKNVEVVEESD